jgi:hypothetical protein
VTNSIVGDLTKPRFLRRFATFSFSAFGALTAIASLVDVFAPGKLADIAWIVWPGIVLAVAGGAIAAWPRPVQAVYSAPNTTIRLVEGDLFADGTAHLVIGMADTFDTAAPHIAPESVQGQFLTRIYGNDAARLDEDISMALQGKPDIGAIAGKLGKTVRYALGTVATLRWPNRCFFLLSYTRMDARSSVETTTDGIWNSLSELWNEVRAVGNGGTVRMPIIGGGQSRISPLLPAQDAIRFTVLSFMLASRKAKVCDELVIVARPVDYAKLDRLELQAFFNSLRASLPTHPLWRCQQIRAALSATICRERDRTQFCGANHKWQS